MRLQPIASAILGVVLSAAAISCGSSTTSSSSSSSSSTTSSQQATAAGNAAIDSSFSAMSATESAGLSHLLVTEGSEKIKQAKALLAANLKNSITYASTASCTAGSIPSPSQYSTTVNATSVTGGVSGNATGTYDISGSTTSFSLDLLLAMNSFLVSETIAGTATDILTNGDIGLASTDTITVSGNDATVHFAIDVGSQNLTVKVGSAAACDFIVDLAITADITVSGASSSGTITSSGCLSYCGEAFSISGSEAL